jgi:hypothetical protein
MPLVRNNLVRKQAGGVCAGVVSVVAALGAATVCCRQGVVLSVTSLQAPWLLGCNDVTATAEVTGQVLLEQVR